MTADFAAARLNMVASQVRTNDVTDLAIQDAMRVVAREALVPSAKTHAAYADTEIEYAPGRWMLSPRDVGKLLQAIKPRPGERALAVAAPYAAAVLETIGLNVERLDGEDLKSPPAGPFDVIVCEGGVAETPEAWKAALAVGGRLGVVERDGPAGRAVLYIRSVEGIGRRSLFDSMVPVMAGFGRVAKFAF